MKKDKIVLMVASLLVGGLLVFSGCKPPKEKKGGMEREVKTEVKKAEKHTKKEAKKVKKEAKREGERAKKEQRKP